jgi:hypothetical protein
MLSTASTCSCCRLSISRSAYCCTLPSVVEPKLSGSHSCAAVVVAASVLVNGHEAKQEGGIAKSVLLAQPTSTCLLAQCNTSQ